MFPRSPKAKVAGTGASNSRADINNVTNMLNSVDNGSRNSLRLPVSNSIPKRRMSTPSALPSNMSAARPLAPHLRRSEKSSEPRSSSDRGSQHDPIAFHVKSPLQSRPCSSSQTAKLGVPHDSVPARKLSGPTLSKTGPLASRVQHLESVSETKISSLSGERPGAGGKRRHSAGGEKGGFLGVLGLPVRQNEPADMSLSPIDSPGKAPGLSSEKCARTPKLQLLVAPTLNNLQTHSPPSPSASQDSNAVIIHLLHEIRSCTFTMQQEVTKLSHSVSHMSVNFPQLCTDSKETMQSSVRQGSRLSQSGSLREVCNQQRVAGSSDTDEKPSRSSQSPPAVHVEASLVNDDSVSLPGVVSNSYDNRPDDVSSSDDNRPGVVSNSDDNRPGVVSNSYDNRPNVVSNSDDNLPGVVSNSDDNLR